MAQLYKSLEVTCRICQAIKSINVPEAVFAQKKFGTIKIQVPPGAICPDHQFIIFVDTKGIIRGYEKIDIHMAAPVESGAPSDKQTIRSFVRIFGLYGLFSLIHAKVFKYPAYLIVNSGEQKMPEELLNKIGDSIVPERYRGTSNIKYIEATDYSKIKLKEKDALLMDSQQNILQTPWEEKLKLEESIIKKALDIIDDNEQFIILQQEVAKIVREAEHIQGILEGVKEIYEDDLIDRISRELMIPKINHYRLILIKDFLRRRISPKVPLKIKNKVEEFLNLL